MMMSRPISRVTPAPLKMCRSLVTIGKPAGRRGADGPTSRRLQSRLESVPPGGPVVRTAPGGPLAAKPGLARLGYATSPIAAAVTFALSSSAHDPLFALPPAFKECLPVFEHEIAELDKLGQMLVGHALGLLGRGEAALGETAERHRSLDIRLKPLLPGMGGEAIIIAPVAWAGDELAEADDEDEADVGGDGGARDLERVGDVVQRKLAPGHQQQAQDAPADARQGVALEILADAFDELPHLRRDRAAVVRFRHHCLPLSPTAASARAIVSLCREHSTVSPFSQD